MRPQIIIENGIRLNRRFGIFRWVVAVRVRCGLTHYMRRPYGGDNEDASRDKMCIFLEIFYIAKRAALMTWQIYGSVVFNRPLSRI